MSTEYSYTLITGASGGLGRELARVFASYGHRLILLGRNAAALRTLSQELGGTSHAEILPRDLAADGAAASIFQETSRRGLTVDILVNNAGFGNCGPFSRSTLKEDHELMQVNMGALTELTKLYLPGMLKAGCGGILNVASTAAFQPGPGMATYYASKAFVLSFSLALSHELKGSGVTVTVLCPGPTETGFQERAGVTGTKLMRLGRMSAASVAKDGYQAFMKKRRLVVSGARNKVVVAAVPFVPRGFVLPLVEWLHK